MQDVSFCAKKKQNLFSLLTLQFKFNFPKLKKKRILKLYCQRARLNALYILSVIERQDRMNEKGERDCEQINVGID